MTLTAVSLFSGMGGDSLGIERSGLKLAGYSEKESIICKTHEMNFKNCELIGNNGDITKIPDDEFYKYHGIDLLFAGFPCQGFSQAGKKKVDDPRNTLSREFVRATKCMEPQYVIGENVKGLLTRKTSDNRNYIDVIVEEFDRIGYKVMYKVFKCHKYGIPQKRERLIIVGMRKCSVYNNFPNFPTEMDIATNLKDIVSFDMYGAKYMRNIDFDMSSIPDECMLVDMDDDSGENNVHPYLQMKIDGEKVYNNKEYSTLFSFGKRASPIHCEIIDIRKPCKTIICTYDHQPRLFVPLRNKNGYYIRPLLVDELKQIQGFPKYYKIAGTVKQQIIQIGNAVPPPLIEKIVRNLEMAVC